MISFDRWLDRRALAVATRSEESGVRPGPVPEGRRTGPEPGLSDPLEPEDMVSRSEALAAGVALIAGLAGLGLARPDRVMARPDYCDGLCDTLLGDRLRSLDRGCREIWSYDPSRTVDFVFKSPTAQALGRGTCIINSNVQARLEHGRCAKRCAADDKRRAKASLPKPTPPPELEPPQQPQSPPAAAPGAFDACANCQSVGGMCCGATRMPDGSVSIAACNNPNYPC